MKSKALKIAKIAEDLVKASNEHDLKGYLACFSEEASIGDVGEAVKGKKAIADWFENKDYEYRMEPIETDESANQIRLTAKVTGTFKGSPMKFQLLMKLNTGLIENLIISVV